MTYWLVNAPFMLVALMATAWGGWRVGRAARASTSRTRYPSVSHYWTIWGGTTAVLVILTAIFDNLMIASGLFTYAEEHISGVKLGLMPVEDFTYAVAAAWILTPATLLHGARRDTALRSGGSQRKGPRAPEEPPGREVRR